MYGRILTASFRRAPGRKALALTALILGTGTASGLAVLALGVSDQMGRELRSIGASLRVLPAEAVLPTRVAATEDRPRPPAALLKESQVAALFEPGFFWRRNVTALATVLRLDARLDGRPGRLVGTWFEHSLRASDGQILVTGLPRVYPAWKIRGRWPRDGATEAALGSALALRLGTGPGTRLRVQVGARAAALTVVGILDTGGPEDAEAFAPLSVAQALAGLPGAAHEGLVRAVTTPESRLARLAELDHRRLSPQDYDRWYCTSFPGSIALRIEETVAGVAAMPVRRTAETEGRVLDRLSGMMVGTAAAAVAVAGLAIVSTIWTILLERRREIGLLRALGAETRTIAWLFLAEGALLGLAGAGGGWLFGWAGGAALGQLVFGRSLPLSWAALPIALATSLGTILLASLPPIRSALRWEPTEVLHAG